MNKKRVLVWIIILLALLNLTTIGTIIYHARKEKKAADTVAVTGVQGNPLNGSFFRNELGFDDEQMEVFRVANQQFRPASNEIIFTIDSLKHQLFVELNKERVDTSKTNQLSREVGALHAQLKDETNTFYLKLKEIATPEQTIKLQEAFEPLFYQDGVNNFGKRRGQGRGHGQRYRYRLENQQNKKQ